jgi:hypothetical protein
VIFHLFNHRTLLLTLASAVDFAALACLYRARRPNSPKINDIADFSPAKNCCSHSGGPYPLDGHCGHPQDAAEAAAANQNNQPVDELHGKLRCEINGPKGNIQLSLYYNAANFTQRSPPA